MERLYDWGKGWITHSGETEATRKPIPGVEDFLRRFLASTPKEEGVMAEKCEYCGRFMQHIWFQSNDHEDSWEDYWSCIHWEKHRKDHPQDWL